MSEQMQKALKILEEITPEEMEGILADINCPLPLTEREVNLDDDVYCIIECGTYRDGLEMQIVKYAVAYKGTKAFVPDDFQTLHDRYQVVPYDSCYATLEEAQQVVKNKFSKNKNITFSVVRENWCWKVNVN